VEDGMRAPWRIKRASARDTDPSRILDSYAVLAPSRTLGRRPAAAVVASGERGEPLTPPPRRPARS
jgi:hypothetical protein